MPIESTETKKISDSGEEKRVLNLEFSNGALEQLEELKKYLNLPESSDASEVVKLGISLLQKLKENDDKKDCSKNLKN